MATETINGFNFYYSDSLKTSLTNITRETSSTNTSLTIPEYITTLGTGCFNTTALAGTGGGVKNIIQELIFRPTSTYSGNLINAGLGNTATGSASTTLKTVTLGGTLTGIGGSVFRSCFPLTSITIEPDNMTTFTFGSFCLANCASLVKININTDDINLSNNNQFVSANISVFLPTAQDFYYRYYKSFVVTDTSSNIMEFGGFDGRNISKYTVSANSIASIPTPAIGAGTSFKLIIPDSISSFINTTTPPGVTSITKVGTGSVLNSTSLTFITVLSFYSGIKTIDANAFTNASNITSLDLSNKPTLTAGCFSGCSSINTSSLQNLRTQTLPYAASELKTAGFNDSQLFTAGYNFILNMTSTTLTEVIKVAGSTLDTLTVPTTEGGVAILTIGNGTNAILTVDASVATLIVSSGIVTIAANAFENITTITSLSLTNKPTLNSNCFFGCTVINSASLQRLKDTNGYTASELKTAGFNIVQLVLAGFKSSDMSSLNFTSSQVYNSINSTSDVNSYSITEQNVLDAGYHFIFGINANTNRLTSITRVAGSTMSSLIIPASDGGVNIIRIGQTGVALTDITGVSSITFSSNVDSIADSAFLNATSITSITLSSTPNLIKNCFSGCSNIDDASLQGLKARGYTVGGITSGINLRNAGFTIAQVIRAGFTVSQIYDLNVTNGYTASELTNAGYHFIYNISNVNVLTGITRVTDSTVNAITIPSSDSGISIFTIGSDVNTTLDTSVTSITVSSGITSIEAGAFSNRSELITLTLISSPTLLENCFNGCVNIDTTSLQRLKNENQYSATQLKTAGFTLSQQIQVGFSVSELKAIGYTDSDLLAAGYAFIFNISNVNVLTGITRVTDSTVNAITIPSTEGGVSILTIGSAVNSTLDTTITSITVSSGITSIEAGAFSNRSSLTTITLEGLNIQKPTLGTSCFSNCPNIDTTSLQKLKTENQYSATELKTAGFSAGQLGTSGYTVSEMKASGYFADELRIAGYTAAQMKDDYSISELKQGGYTIYQLGPNDANYSSSQIFAADFSSSELLAAGYHFIYNISNVNVLTGITRVTGSTVSAITIPYYDGGFNILTIGSAVNSTLDTTITSITVSSGITSIEAGAFSNRSSLTTITLLSSPTLLENCFNSCVNVDTTSLQRLKTTNLYSASQLKTAGLSAGQLQKGGYSATELQSNYTSQDILTAGYTVAQLKAAGYSAKQLKDAGYNDADILAAGYPVSQLQEAGFLASQLKAAGYSASELKAAGYSAAELKAAGYLAAELKAAGYLAAELKAAEYTIADLKGAEYNDAAILAAGYLAAQLKAAGYSASQLKDANYTAVQLREGGYNDTIILASGYSVQALKAANYTASQLRTVGFTALEILSGGYDEQAVIDAFSTSGTSEPYVPCFNENSKILCFVDGVEKELLVQNIRNGILVKTLCSGYIPVCMIGTKKIYNPGNNERTTERLYICKREMYPELNQDLIITGCHSILVDEFTDVQREKTLEKFNDIFVTDDKYRLIAAFDERAEPYNNAGEFNIYHFALENENYYYNYGIYANGLLVETCSKRYLKEKTDMTLL